MVGAFAAAFVSFKLLHDPTKTLSDFQIVPVRSMEKSFAQHLKSKRYAVVEEGSWITFLRREEADQVYVQAGYEIPMTRLGKTDIWAVRVLVPHLEESIFSVGFAGMKAGDPTPGERFVMVGEKAPQLPASDRKLDGKVSEERILMPPPFEYRSIITYMPPGNHQGKLPVIYMADGQLIRTFAAALESMIESGKVPPTAIVGVVSGDNLRRSREYRAGEDEKAFQRHLQFVEEIVIPYAEEKLEISSRPEDRTIMGFSHGATFAVAAGLTRPGLFRRIVAFAPTIPQLPAKYVTDAKSRTEPKPSMFLATAKLDEFHPNGAPMLKQMKALGVQTQFMDTHCSHDLIFCRLAFRAAMEG